MIPKNGLTNINKDEIIKDLKRNINKEINKELYLAERCLKLNKAGNNLAIAAIKCARDYDGVHHLMLAVSKWSKAIANEGKI